MRMIRNIGTDRAPLASIPLVMSDVMGGDDAACFWTGGSPLP